jgi:urease accessory protein
LTGDRILTEDVGLLALDAAVGSSPLRSAELQFATDETSHTYVAKQFAPYPFHFCRPFYVSGDPKGLATVYVQSCAGGIFEHDRLRLNVKAAQGSLAHVTTSASTIVHSMPAGEASQVVDLVANTDSLIEYLPDPMILFPGARINSAVNVVIDDTARVILSDAFLLHDHQNRGEVFDWLHSDITVRDSQSKVLVRDRIRVDGRSMLAAIPGVTGRYTAQASFMVLGRGLSTELLTSMRAVLDSVEGIYAGVSLLPGGAGVFSRILATDGVSLRAAQLVLWSEARRSLTGSTPMPRRK